jgi:23S rRNA pseudouridine2605 synthase
MSEERLQKILSRAGVASRRKAEQIITEGRVTVNGKVITELGTKADLDHDHIKVDGKLLHAPRKLVYIALNKPKGCVTTSSDPEGRETVMDLVPSRERVYPVGRLAYTVKDAKFEVRPFMVRNYLRIRPAWRFLGRQMLVVGRRL